MKITEAKMKCPECGVVSKVGCCVCDGEQTQTGLKFESDGSMGCPRCFYVDNMSVTVKALESEV